MISIIVPAYNVETWLDAAIDSVRRQSRSDWEVLLVNDGSRDRTGVIADQWAQRDYRIRVFHQDNRGTSAARNVGLDNARGEWIAFLDADDELEENALQWLIETTERYRVTAVLGGYRRIQENGAEEPGGMVRFPMLPMETVYGPRTVIGRYISGGFPTVVWNGLYARELFQDLRFPHGRWHEDSWLAPELLARSPGTVVIPYCVYRYRHRPGSFMNTLDEKRLDSIGACIQLKRIACELLSDVRTRVRCEGIVQKAASGLTRHVCVAAEDIRDPAARRRFLRRWRRDIYREIPRSRFLVFLLNPRTTMRGRINAGTMMIGLRVHAHACRLITYVHRWRRT